jgi:hypothetical protein
MPEFKAPADRLDRIDYSAKGIRLIDGAKFLVRTPQLMEHFLTSTPAAAGFTATDTGGGTAFATGATTPGGAAIGVTAGTTNNAGELGGTTIAWQPSTQAGSNGPSGTALMVLEVRAKFVGTTTATDGDFYIGWADNKTYTNSLPYVTSTTSTFTTSVPSDFAGFGYSSIATSGVAFQAGGNPIFAVTTIANTDTATALSAGGVVVKDSLYHIYRVELDILGNASFYIDDVFKGSVALACTAATLYTPYINVVAKNTHVHTATVDYVHVGATLV